MRIFLVTIIIIICLVHFACLLVVMYAYDNEPYGMGKKSKTTDNVVGNNKPDGFQMRV